jgi:hypothetical protein
MLTILILGFSLEAIPTPAQPNVEDGRRFAHYMNEASHGLVRSLFGPHFERIIAEAFLSPGHDLSYETAVFAETEGRIVGMTSSYCSAQHLASSDKPVIAAAGLQVIRMIPLVPARDSGPTRVLSHTCHRCATGSGSEAPLERRGASPLTRLRPGAGRCLITSGSSDDPVDAVRLMAVPLSAIPRGRARPVVWFLPLWRWLRRPCGIRRALPVRLRRRLRTPGPGRHRGRTACIRARRLRW